MSDEPARDDTDDSARRTVFRNGHTLQHGQRWAARCDPISGAWGTLHDAYLAHAHIDHVIVKDAEWDAFVVCVPHEAGALPIVIASRHPARGAYDARTVDAPTWVSVPRVPGYYFLFIDSTFVKDPDACARWLVTMSTRVLTHMPLDFDGVTLYPNKDAP